MRFPSSKLSGGAPLLRKAKRGGTVHLEPQRPSGSSEHPLSAAVELSALHRPCGSSEQPLSFIADTPLPRHQPFGSKEQPSSTIVDGLSWQRPSGSREQPASTNAQPPLGSSEQPFSFQELTKAAQMPWKSDSNTERVCLTDSGPSAVDGAGAIKGSKSKARTAVVRRIWLRPFIEKFSSKKRSSAAISATRSAPVKIVPDKSSRTQWSEGPPLAFLNMARGNPMLTARRSARLGRESNPHRPRQTSHPCNGHLGQANSLRRPSRCLGCRRQKRSHRSDQANSRPHSRGWLRQPTDVGRTLRWR